MPNDSQGDSDGLSVNRRRFLAVGSSGVATVAGCLDFGDTETEQPTEDTSDSTTDGDDPDDPNPYGKQTLTVGLQQEVSARHDMEEIIHPSLEYWEENSEYYAGYPIEYEYRPNTDDPDVLIIVVEDIEECGNHTGEIAGCAPVPQDTAPETAEIRIVAGYRKDWMKSTLKHELGHTLGLEHDDEPAHIMSNELEDRIPNYEERQTAIDNYENAIQRYVDANEAWGVALDAWEDQNDSRTEEKAREAGEKWESALERVIETKQITDELDEADAYEKLAETATHIEYLIRAADEAVKMAEEAQAGGDPTPYQEATNDYLESSRNYSFNEYADVAEELGFRIEE